MGSRLLLCLGIARLLSRRVRRRVRRGGRSRRICMLRRGLERSFSRNRKCGLGGVMYRRVQRRLLCLRVVLRLLPRIRSHTMSHRNISQCCVSSTSLTTTYQFPICSIRRKVLRIRDARISHSTSIRAVGHGCRYPRGISVNSQ